MCRNRFTDVDAGLAAVVVVGARITGAGVGAARATGEGARTTGAGAGAARTTGAGAARAGVELLLFLSSASTDCGNVNADNMPTNASPLNFMTRPQKTLN